MTAYYLPHHVYFCRRGTALVFLDLQRDDYILINGEASLTLQTLVSSERQEVARPASDSLCELLEHGLLTLHRERGRPIAPTKVELALDALVEPEDIAGMQISLRHVCHFAVACIVAAKHLRWNTLQETVEMVRRRKNRQTPRRDETADFAKARELTAIFSRLRSFFPSNYLCLYDSLALIEFLAVYEVFPTWVFGIKLEPWAAHCWVQECQYVFNEDVEEAAGYSPVMAV